MFYLFYEKGINLFQNEYFVTSLSLPKMEKKPLNKI